MKELLGKTFSKVVVNNDGEELQFIGPDSYMFYHDQDCCESVGIEDVCGDLGDLENSPILQADEETNHEETDWGSKTWTFYRFATAKGSVVVRWSGESNGYYSERVDFKAINA